MSAVMVIGLQLPQLQRPAANPPSRSAGASIPAIKQTNSATSEEQIMAIPLHLAIRRFKKYKKKYVNGLGDLKIWDTQNTRNLKKG